VQVDPIKTNLKPPEIKRLKLEHEKLLSNFAFNFKLRRYTVDYVFLQDRGAPTADTGYFSNKVEPARCCPPRHVIHRVCILVS